MSTKRWGSIREPMPLGPNGKRLCRYCEGPITAKRRTTFCSEACAEEWRVRNWPSYARDKVLERDKGVCVTCGVDTVTLQKQLLDGAEWHLPGARERWRERARQAGFDPDRKTWWDMDHVVAVVEGGGQCGLDNLQTLCMVCHKKKTAELAARRAEERRLEQHTREQMMVNQYERRLGQQSLALEDS